jgi:hypothetical protein
MTRDAYEKPQRKNPHRLTVNQHVFPSLSIARFADGSGHVCVCDIARKYVRRTKPDDPIFGAKRAWDHRAERGYMKSIEDAFQALAVKIIGGVVLEIDDANKRAVNDFYALWYARSWHRHLPQQEIQMKGVTGGGLTMDQEEMLEKNFTGFSRAGGKIPARQMNGLQIQIMIDHHLSGPLMTSKWGIIRAHEGEFVVPDVPEHTIVPLTPMLCLMAPAPNGTVLKDNVAVINRAIMATSQAYFFARDLSKCPC